MLALSGRLITKNATMYLVALTLTKPVLGTNFAYIVAFLPRTYGKITFGYSVLLSLKQLYYNTFPLKKEDSFSLISTEVAVDFYRGRKYNRKYDTWYTYRTWLEER